MSRFARTHRVFFIEEPIFTPDIQPNFEIRNISKNLNVAVPHLPAGISDKDVNGALQSLLVEMFSEQSIHPDIFWYYTPMALPISRGFTPELVVYDCMDELCNFKFAPPALKLLEKELFAKADIVFTGGNNLYAAKKNQHHNIYSFPSSIDKKHFAKARLAMDSPEDQANIPGPRFGFYGVIDERFDIDLIRQVAERNKGWNFVMIGPVVKIDPETLPKLPNIHYLGSKTYEELPVYLGGWHIAMVPFLRNDSTKYISPTKTPEYLSGGVPVISTSIVDVVNPYGNAGLVHIADTADEFIEAAKKEFDRKDREKWLGEVDKFLSDNSWDNTWLRMANLIQDCREATEISTPLNLKKVYV